MRFRSDCVVDPGLVGDTSCATDADRLEPDRTGTWPPTKRAGTRPPRRADEDGEPPGQDGEEHAGADEAQPEQDADVLRATLQSRGESKQRDQRKRVREQRDREQALQGHGDEQRSRDEHSDRRQSGGRGRPRDSHTASAMKRSGATWNMFRSSIRNANCDAYTATWATSRNDAAATARKARSATVKSAFQRTASPKHTISAQTGMIPTE